MITAPCAGSTTFAGLVKRLDEHIEQKRGTRADARHTLAQVRAGWCERCPIRDECYEWASQDAGFAGVAGGVYFNNTNRGIREYSQAMVRPKAASS